MYLLNKYITYLDKYSSVDFLENQLKENHMKIELYEAEIKKEYRFYDFDRHSILKNAEMIREKLPELIKNKSKLITVKQTTRKKIKPHTLSYQPVKNESLKAYNSISNNISLIQLRNFYYKRLIIEGYIIDTDIVYLDKTIIIDPFLNADVINTTSFTADYLIDEIIYHVAGEDSTYTQRIIPYRAPE